MKHERRFEQGAAFEQVFETTKGWLVVLADVALRDGQVHLENILIEPLHTKRLAIGSSAVLRIRREIEGFVRGEGYTGLVIDGVRVKAGKQRRPLTIGGTFR